MVRRPAATILATDLAIQRYSLIAAADQVLTDGDQFPGAKWFKGARLNYAENALRNRSDKIALISRLENGSRTTLSYAELYQQVAECAAACDSPAWSTGDRVAGFMPNIPKPSLPC